MNAPIQVVVDNSTATIRIRIGENAVDMKPHAIKTFAFTLLATAEQLLANDQKVVVASGPLPKTG